MTNPFQKGVLQIDQELALDKSSAGMVSSLASNAQGFQQSFAKAMVKMGNIEVLVGNGGQIERTVGYAYLDSSVYTHTVSI
ncbi:unnamed protein product [Thlaspi arvense]|uniref:peroxidase n=1 Tax=Thlaspi arvense TaxID=13288 RepID=A0AAU9S6H0_THLAR|nr:unnamed protein product [Thlaspi arvense]